MKRITPGFRGRMKSALGKFLKIFKARKEEKMQDLGIRKSRHSTPEIAVYTVELESASKELNDLAHGVSTAMVTMPKPKEIEEIIKREFRGRVKEINYSGSWFGEPFEDRAVTGIHYFVNHFEKPDYIITVVKDFMGAHWILVKKSSGDTRADREKLREMVRRIIRSYTSSE